jgi:hypothetical protein
LRLSPWADSSATAIRRSHPHGRLVDRLQALHHADIQLEAAATRIASTGPMSPDGSPLDIIDLSAEIVALMSAQNMFEANLATLKTADQIQKSLIDINT